MRMGIQEIRRTKMRYEPKEVIIKNYAFAQIDGPDDIWFWAIVKDYKGCQDYGDIICAFQDGYEPSPDMVIFMIKVAMERDRAIEMLDKKI